MSLISRVASAPLLGAIALYRLTVSPSLGVNCRHLPSCSDYAREAIDRNGAWRGCWLALARLDTVWAGSRLRPPRPWDAVLVTSSPQAALPLATTTCAA